MAFLDDHPDYESYDSINGYYYHDVPSSTWRQLESLVEEAGGYEGEDLERVVALIARKIRFGHIESVFAYNLVPDVISELRKLVNNGDFPLFMDCLSILCNDCDLDVETINDFMKKNSIGYTLEKEPFSSKAHWKKFVFEDDSSVSDYNQVLSQMKNSSSAIHKIEEEKNVSGKKTKIFISHSSKDEKYVLVLTAFLRNIKVPSKNIICTTDPIHIIPSGENSYEWLKSQFMDYDLHMIYVLSDNYYKSVPCLNEMGAAWIVAKHQDILLLPGFKFDKWKNKGGCLSSDIQSASLEWDDTRIKAWLIELRDKVTTEFGLNKMNELEWERYREEFIEKIGSVEKNLDKVD